MPDIKPTDIMKKQTELAWQYLEKARPLIIYEKLVPVTDTQIDLYEQVWEKIVPPDYRYWLTTYGSGLIEFLQGELPIISIYELKESDGRDVSADDPKNCHKRIYIGYAGAPVASCLDSTIIDEDGCAPVIETDVYGNKVEKVLASSWPMFVIKSIIDIAINLKERAQIETYTNDQIAAIDALANLDFASIDKALEDTFTRAIAYNNTQNGDGDDVVNAEMTISMLGFLDKCKDKQSSNSGTSKLLSLITGLFNNNDEFSKKVKEMEDQIDKGYSSLCDFSYFFSHGAEKRHEKGVNLLLGHERREVRKLAEQGQLRLNPGKAE